MRLLICTQVIDSEHPVLGFFVSWVRAFAAHAERIDVICLEQGAHDLPAHVHVHSLGKETGAGKLRQLWRFYRYFGRALRARPTHVFYHMGAIYNLLGAPFYLLRRGDTPQFYWWKTHGHIDRKGRLAARFVDRIYTAVEESFPIDSPKRHVIGHAIDTHRFTPGAAPRRAEILFTGRLTRSKHVEEVIDIVAQLRARGQAVTATIIGAPVDATYATELTERVATRGLSGVVTFIPGLAQTELVSYYQRARVFINPATNDGLDKVVLEAMACGLIPLTCNRSFTRLLTPHGLYVERGDQVGYVARCEEILGLTSDEYAARVQPLTALVQTDRALATLPHRIFGVQ